MSNSEPIETVTGFAGWRLYGESPFSFTKRAVASLSGDRKVSIKARLRDAPGQPVIQTFNLKIESVTFPSGISRTTVFRVSYNTARHGKIYFSIRVVDDADDVDFDIIT